MKNVTYLLGAGASYHALPLLATVSSRMKAYSSFLKTAVDKNFLKNDFAPTFIVELDKLIVAESESTSIDAYAKELSNGQKSLELLHLKALLSSFLIFEQLVKPEDFFDVLNPSHLNSNTEGMTNMIKNPLDSRYRTFWGDFVNERDKLPNNVRVLSWNYDMQMEFSYSRQFEYSLELVQQNLQVFPSPEHTSIDPNKFCILKLNGTAGLIHTHDRPKPINLFDLNKHHLDSGNLGHLVDLLKENYHRAFSNPLFSFAWENEGMVNKTREMAQEVMETTDVLVVIGYSFPSFNRTVDREIFKRCDQLDTIYYQAPKEELPLLTRQLGGINSSLEDKVIGIDQLRSFYIPPEY